MESVLVLALRLNRALRSSLSDTVPALLIDRISAIRSKESSVRFFPSPTFLKIVRELISLAVVDRARYSLVWHKGWTEVVSLRLALSCRLSGIPVRWYREVPSLLAEKNRLYPWENI